MVERSVIFWALIHMRAVSQESFVDAPWHLALCRPNQGHIAFQNLVKAGFEVFMPRHRASWRWRGRLVDGLRPVFGGYLFFSTDPAAQRWREVANMPGVGSLVKIGLHSPARVPSAVVTGLMRRCDAEGCLIPPDDFQAGEVVCVTSGPFAGFIGTVEKMDQERRIHMLLTMLGRDTPLIVSHQSVERAR